MLLEEKMGIRAWLEDYRGKLTELVPVSPIEDPLVSDSHGNKYGHFDDGAVLCMPSLECGRGTFVYHAAITRAIREVYPSAYVAVHFLAYRAVDLPKHYSSDTRRAEDLDRYETSYWYAGPGATMSVGLRSHSAAITGTPFADAFIDTDGVLKHNTYASGAVPILDSVYARNQGMPRFSYMNREKRGEGHWNFRVPNVGITYVGYPLIDPPDWSKSKLWKIADYMHRGATDALSEEETEMLSYVWWAMNGPSLPELDYIVYCQAHGTIPREPNTIAPKYRQAAGPRSLWYMRIKGDRTYGPERSKSALELPGEKSVHELPSFYMGDCSPDSKEAAESILGRNHAYEAAVRSEWNAGFGAVLRGIHPSAMGAIDDVRIISRQELIDFKPDRARGGANMMRQHSIAYRYTPRGWMTYCGYPALRAYASILAGPAAFAEPFEWQHAAVPVTGYEGFTYEASLVMNKPDATANVSIQDLPGRIAAVYDNDMRFQNPPQKLLGEVSDPVPVQNVIWNVEVPTIPKTGPIPQVPYFVEFVDDYGHRIRITGDYTIEE